MSSVCAPITSLRRLLQHERADERGGILRLLNCWGGPGASGSPKRQNLYWKCNFCLSAITSPLICFTHAVVIVRRASMADPRKDCSSERLWFITNRKAFIADCPQRKWPIWGCTEGSIYSQSTMTRSRFALNLFFFSFSAKSSTYSPSIVFINESECMQVSWHEAVACTGKNLFVQRNYEVCVYGLCIHMVQQCTIVRTGLVHIKSCLNFHLT